MNVVSSDLFSNTTDSLAHCVSQCFTMGRGIAVEFKKRFGRVDELKSQKPTIGSIATLQLDDGRWIYYLVTKAKASGKPTMESLRASLIAMREHAFEHQVKRIAMPQIGCGLDRLHWNAVKPMIEDVFEDTGIEIQVYQFS